ncbi:6-carboxytetrahydropterin synthase [Magnetovirga frankeli]|uniref:6-pyruvoyl trahydropterin synthase family protein n=1 Tax=Magnetovirga frankeli TaxID=947516 RepID=UPI0012939683|nr:6-carboxytetrahydropterin synthase [gamma proteobacterium SS-5]
MPQLFVNRLTNLDFAYLDPQLGLLGETWLVDLELEGQLNAEGMVLDFGLVKKQVKWLLDQAFDHCLLVPLEYPGCQLDQVNGTAQLVFHCQDGQRIRHSSPQAALCPLPLPRIEPEGVAACIRQRLLPGLAENCTELRLRLYPEAIDGPFYQYSHGLRQHAGNCRRIAHGHRSAIQVQRNGVAAPELAAAWARRWRHAYLAERAVLLGEYAYQGRTYARFGYDTGEGRYELELPAEACVLLQGDTTVERIAQHIATELASDQPGETIQVRAFEGVGKGALAQVRSPR